jgi:hypothetical protein
LTVFPDRRLDARPINIVSVIIELQPPGLGDAARRRPGFTLQTQLATAEMMN